MIIYIPQKASFPNTLLLLLRHINNRNADFASLKIISDSTGALSAILYDIPNRPLFNGLEEDDLQAFTFSKYMKTGDESWPLLFPMVKGVVRAMDAIQEVTKENGKVTVSKFVITGHSKRGHTTWLTGAVDARVQGIIPVAIDILTSTAQLPHHLESFRGYSTSSQTTTDLLKELDYPRGKRLIQMIDAYSHKEKLLLPKLIVSATNDQFFTTDALNLYWNDLKGPKWILYLSNANHISAYSDPRVNSTAFAFVRSIATGNILPQFTWKFDRTKTGVLLTITTDSSAATASVWTSASSSKDFRQSLWVSKAMKEMRIKSNKPKDSEKTKVFELEIKSPFKGFIAVFGEITFVQNKGTFLLSTQTQISGNK